MSIKRSRLSLRLESLEARTNPAPVVLDGIASHTFNVAGYNHFQNNARSFATTSSAFGFSDANMTQGQQVTTKNGGVINTALSDAFDGVLSWGIPTAGGIPTSNTYFDADGNVDITGNTVTGDPNTNGTDGGSFGGLQLSQQNAIFALSPTVPVIRSIITITNPTAAPITQTIGDFNKLGSGTDTTIFSTSSGGATLDPVVDRWVGTFQSYIGNTSSDPRILQVLQGPGVVQTPYSTPWLGNGNSQPAWNYSVTLNPGETKSIMVFVGLYGSKAQATSDGHTVFDGVGTVSSNGLLGGLSDLQLAQIVNWDFSSLVIGGGGGGGGGGGSGDTTAPTVSISPPSASGTGVGPITYTATYADANFNGSTLLASNVMLNRTGTAFGTVSVSPGSGLTRTVTISGITGDGTLGISLVPGTANDRAGNQAPAAGPSETFGVDNTAPTVSISSPSASSTTGASITYTVTYADANFNASTLTAAGVTLNKTGTANGTVGVSGSGNTRTVTISGITGNGTIGISLAAGTASDTAGNLAPTAGPSATFTANAPAATTPSFAVGNVGGAVRLFNTQTGGAIATVRPLDTGTAQYTGLVEVALGDFTGDGVADLAVSAAASLGVDGLGVGKAGKVFVYDGNALANGTLTLVRTFTPFATHDGPTGTAGAYTNGLNIAAGDVNGDGRADLIAGTRSGNGTTSGLIEVGRLVVIDGTSAAGLNTVIGGIQTPFSRGYQKGIVVAVGDVDGTGGDEIAVTRGGPVNSPNPSVQQIKVKVLKLQGAALAELNLAADGATAFAPFGSLAGPSKAINRDGRVAFVDANGDGKAELVFSALDPLSSTNEQVRIGVYAINPAALTGAATIQSTGSDGGTYLIGAAVADHAITHVAATGAQQSIALITQSASSGVVYLAPLTGAVRTGGFSLSIVTGGITIEGI